MLARSRKLTPGERVKCTKEVCWYFLSNGSRMMDFVTRNYKMN
jgi:hypothetical protein